MNLLFTGWLTGLLGGLHCIAMCGPIVMASPVLGNTTRMVWLSRFIYHLGRLLAYATLGLLMGYFGSSLAFIGFQQWSAIIAGIAICIMGLFSTRWLEQRLGLFFIKLSPSFRKFWSQRKSPFALLALGFMNGLLPCGFVYVALVGALATGTPFLGAAYMVLFGWGTLPWLSLLNFANLFSIKFKTSANKLTPYFTLGIGILFLFRGLNLHIPYLSPPINSEKGKVENCCKKP